MRTVALEPAGITAPLLPVTVSRTVATKRSPALWVLVQTFSPAERLIVVPALTVPILAAAAPGPGVTVLPAGVLAGVVGALGVVEVLGGVVVLPAVDGVVGALPVVFGTSVPVGGVVSRFARSRSRWNAESAASESALSPSLLQAPSSSAHDSASGVVSFRI